MSDLTEYLDFFQLNHDYSYRMCSIHANVICSTLHSTEQTRASLAPIIWQILIGVFRRNPPAGVWTDTQDVKKVTDLLQSWDRPVALNYTRLTLKTVMVLALTIVKEAIRPEPAKNCS